MCLLYGADPLDEWYAGNHVMSAVGVLGARNRQPTRANEEVVMGTHLDEGPYQIATHRGTVPEHSAQRQWSRIGRPSGKSRRVRLEGGVAEPLLPDCHGLGYGMRARIVTRQSRSRSWHRRRELCAGVGLLWERKVIPPAPSLK